MSSEQLQPPEEMTRDQLEDEVRERREHQQYMEETLERQGAALSLLINQLNGNRGDDEGADPAEPDFIAHAAQAADGLADAFDRVNDVESTLANVRSKVDSRQDVSRETDNWLAVVEYAHDHKDHRNNAIPGSWVKLFKDDIASATNLSQRRGGQLIDEWTDGKNEKEGTRKQEYEPPSAGNGNTATRKAMKIDLELWHDPRGGDE